MLKTFLKTDQCKPKFSGSDYRCSPPKYKDVIVTCLLQTSVAVQDDNGAQEVHVPIGVKCFAVIDPHIPRRTFCHVTKSSSGRFTMYDMKLVDFRGKIYITIEQFQSAALTSLVRSPKIEDVGYKCDWVESKLSWKKRDLSTCAVIVFKDCHGIADSFMTSLSRNSGAKVNTFLF